MATFLKSTHISTDQETIFNTKFKSSIPKLSYPSWYSPETGIYHSKHPSVTLPSDPFLDVVSFIFSHEHSGQTALIDSSSGFSLSYSKIFPLVKSVASGLHQMGVSQGDVVLISLPNSIHFPIVFLGILSLGAIVTAINPLSSLSEVKKLVLDCKPSFGLCLPEKVDELSAFGFPVIGVPNTESLMPNSKVCRNSDFYKLISSDPKLAPRPKINQQDTAAILYSSGTTGTCKGTILTHGNFIAMVVLFVRFEASTYCDLPSENVYLATSPMFHIYGLSLFVMGLLSLGTTIVVMRKFDADQLVRVIDKYGVTHFPTVPPVLMKLTSRAKDASDGSLKSLRQVSCGAAPVIAKCIEDFVQTLPHVDFIQGYGMTESTAVGTRGYNTENFYKYSSVGLLAPNAQARVVNWTTGCSLPPGSTGELWLRSPGTMKGYLNNDEATKSTIEKDGWLHTGDIVYFDEDGYLYVVDRLKEVIKYKGFQIAPADLESVLMSHPEIVDAAVTGARDEEAGEIPVAFVVRKEGSTLSEAAVIEFVAKQVTPYKKIRKVNFIASVPRSAAGKILRRTLRPLLLSRV
ncbi:4-coumarate--CoA ligase-like 6 [Coffea eugenioides]|uniref:4-coumarate--CoA ligase-like 6 n=1 Tax=Coffea eugenioides TaxID=49369 RepID=UPI000F611AC3|nr:4-coumarate--CoA ligase-like 6 [Coffea eugenioides]